MPEVLDQINCIYCGGGLVCVKERYYCTECGERAGIAEAYAREKLSDIKKASKHFAGKREQVKQAAEVSRSKKIRKR